MPIDCSTSASRPAVTCSPEATTASYSRASWMRWSLGLRRFPDPGDELVGLAGHRRDDDGDLVAGIDLALDVAGDIADAVDVGDGGAAELHHDARHGKRVSRVERSGLSEALEDLARYVPCCRGAGCGGLIAKSPTIRKKAHL